MANQRRIDSYEELINDIIDQKSKVVLDNFCFDNAVVLAKKSYQKAQCNAEICTQGLIPKSADDELATDFVKMLERIGENKRGMVRVMVDEVSPWLKNLEKKHASLFIKQVKESGLMNCGFFDPFYVIDDYIVRVEKPHESRERHVQAKICFNARGCAKRLNDLFSGLWKTLEY